MKKVFKTLLGKSSSKKNKDNNETPEKSNKNNTNNPRPSMDDDDDGEIDDYEIGGEDAPGSPIQRFSSQDSAVTNMSTIATSVSHHRGGGTSNGLYPGNTSAIPSDKLPLNAMAKQSNPMRTSGTGANGPHNNFNSTARQTVNTNQDQIIDPVSPQSTPYGVSAEDQFDIDNDTFLQAIERVEADYEDSEDGIDNDTYNDGLESKVTPRSGGTGGKSKAVELLMQLSNSHDAVGDKKPSKASASSFRSETDRLINENDVEEDDEEQTFHAHRSPPNPLLLQPPLGFHQHQGGSRTSGSRVGENRINSTSFSDRHNHPIEGSSSLDKDNNIAPLEDQYPAYDPNYDPAYDVPADHISVTSKNRSRAGSRTGGSVRGFGDDGDDFVGDEQYHDQGYSYNQREQAPRHPYSNNSRGAAGDERVGAFMEPGIGGESSGTNSDGEISRSFSTTVAPRSRDQQLQHHQPPQLQNQYRSQIPSNGGYDYAYEYELQQQQILNSGYGQGQDQYMLNELGEYGIQDAPLSSYQRPLPPLPSQSNYPLAYDMHSQNLHPQSMRYQQPPPSSSQSVIVDERQISIMMTQGYSYDEAYAILLSALPGVPPPPHVTSMYTHQQMYPPHHPSLPLPLPMSHIPYGGPPPPTYPHQYQPHPTGYGYGGGGGYSNSGYRDNDDDLQRALRMSLEEEQARLRRASEREREQKEAVERANEKAMQLALQKSFEDYEKQRLQERSSVTRYMDQASIERVNQEAFEAARLASILEAQGMSGQYGSPTNSIVRSQYLNQSGSQYGNNGLNLHAPSYDQDGPTLKTLVRTPSMDPHQQQYGSPNRDFANHQQGLSHQSMRQYQQQGNYDELRNYQSNRQQNLPQYQDDQGEDGGYGNDQYNIRGGIHRHHQVGKIVNVNKGDYIYPPSEHLNQYPSESFSDPNSANQSFSHDEYHQQHQFHRGAAIRNQMNSNNGRQNYSSNTQNLTNNGLVGLRTDSQDYQHYLPSKDGAMGNSGLLGVSKTRSLDQDNGSGLVQGHLRNNPNSLGDHPVGHSGLRRVINSGPNMPDGSGLLQMNQQIPLNQNYYPGQQEQFGTSQEDVGEDDGFGMSSLQSGLQYYDNRRRGARESDVVDYETTYSEVEDEIPDHTSLHSGASNF